MINLTYGQSESGQNLPRRGAARQRRVTGDAAVATWNLKRVRRRGPATAADAALLRRTLSLGRPDVSGFFEYDGRRVAVRPLVAAMLVHLWAAGGGAVPVADMCAAVHGRAASLRAVRQIAFRASRAFERADCPLIVGCRASTVFLEVRVRTFVRRDASVARA